MYHSHNSKLASALHSKLGSYFTTLVHFSQEEWLQFTLVDCPGHASLIKTVLGGAQIIDMMMLVVDITKGMQTQVC